MSGGGLDERRSGVVTPRLCPGTGCGGVLLREDREALRARALQALVPVLVSPDVAAPDLELEAAGAARAGDDLLLHGDGDDHLAAVADLLLEREAAAEARPHLVRRAAARAAQLVVDPAHGRMVAHHG